MSNLMFIAPVDSMLIENKLDFLIPIIDIALIFLVTEILVKLVKFIGHRMVKVRKQRLGEDRARRFETAQKAVVSLAKYLLFFIAIAVSLGELGLEGVMTSMLAAAGIGGLALSIGAQSLVKDFTSGLFMIFEGTLTVGDYVNIAGTNGTVEAVTMRTTSIRGDSGELVIVPNSEVKTIVNYSCPSYMSMVEVGIAYEADCDRALDIMLEVASEYMKEIPESAVREPVRSGIASLGASAVVCRVAIFVKPPAHAPARRELYRRIKLRFEEEGIEITYNKLVLYNGDR